MSRNRRAESRKIPEVVHLLFALIRAVWVCGFDGWETLAFLFFGISNDAPRDLLEENRL
jgi:hypothetical protein